MSTGSKKKRRIDRVTSVELPPGVLGNLWGHLRRGHVLVRLALCAATALVLWAVTSGWAPPPPAYELNEVLSRDIVARTAFERPDEKATEDARDLARAGVIATYDHDPSRLEQLRAKIENEVTEMLAAESPDKVAAVWNQYQLQLAPGTPQPSPEERAQRFQAFREALTAEGALDSFKNALKLAFEPLVGKGVIEKIPPEHTASPEKIFLREPNTDTKFGREVPVSDVLLENVTSNLQKALQKSLPTTDIADRVFARVKSELQPTLKLDVGTTTKAQNEAAANVKTQKELIPAGSVLVRARDDEGRLVPINETSLEKLNLEYQQELANRPFSAKVSRSLAVLGMYVALYVLCGFYIYHRDPRIIDDLPRLATLLSLVVVAVTLIVVISNGWRAELLPLMLFGMTVAIAYEQEIALLLSAAITLVSVIALGHSLAEAVVLLAATAGAILLLGRVRSRNKLLSVGFIAAGVAVLTTIGVGTLEGEPIAITLKIAALLAIWAVIAGALMTALLPIVEKVFKVQTDLSLIELGDPSHQLLQELIRRAPGTYNHSITVASLAEAAAEAIGARGLLVRVGAYFHDIGKMLKPGYFAENQGQGDNRHRSLVPAMSTLVIIAHVKDGADLARQNKIPEPIIDFIQQHHGTTLVEYFYRQASESKKADPNSADVDESSFRYPGPKPQTKEAGILMLADAVESASRVLVEPTPARIENLVEDISRKRLLDGQFDECGLTLEEVRKIGDSLVKSLTAVYHGRVKYPGQETA